MFLVAAPQLADPNFAKGVVFILQHDSNGAFGLTVNNPTSLKLGNFAQGQDMICHPALENDRVYLGGPVEPGRGWILHECEEVEERKEIIPNLYLSGSTMTLRKLLEEGQRPFRLILGYAGWAPGQLEEEMAQGAWITVPEKADYIFSENPSETWNTVLRDLGVDPYKLALAPGVH